MRTPPAQTHTVALLGNPNSGKSTLFSALVGVRQRVGNYPGVTVEKKTGVMDLGGCRCEVIDLPGLYSLAPRSRDEMVSVDVLFGRGAHRAPVDAVVCVVDACNLERQLYLVSQVLELGLPTVLAVNMIDLAERQGIVIRFDRLKDRLPVPVVRTQANRRIGIAQLKEALASVVGRPARSATTPLPEVFEAEVDRLQPLLGSGRELGAEGPPERYLIRRLILDVSGYLQQELLEDTNGKHSQALETARRRLADAGHAVPSVETSARYGWIRTVLEDVVQKPVARRVTVSDRIDHALAHRLWGTLVFVLVMLVVFQSVFAWAQPLMRAIDAGIAWAGGVIQARMAEGALRSLLVDGVLGGVGGVLTFLPQILILFLFIAVLEDCGYMARAAFLMDKFMARVGLSGKSFIPMLSSFACAVPGIMAARVIENERDRLTTILIAPLLTCSARLPVYALLIAAFIPSHAYLGGLLSLQGLTLAGLYALGIATAVLVALILKRTILRGETPPFVMELPSYKWPSPRNILFRVAGRAWGFIRCAGTIILAVSIVVWAALYFPHDREVVEAPFQAQKRGLEAELRSLPQEDPQRAVVAAKLTKLEGQIAGEYQRQSILGRLGLAIEPVFRPLGWDWRISSAVVSSFPAREIVVATLGVVFNLGEDIDPGSQEDLTRISGQLRSATWETTGRPLFNVPVALSLMVFYALCAQCAATLAVIRRETNSWRWPAFTFAYMTTLAYCAALATYHLGMFLSGT
jgi:ferrous iron transport protein B